MQAGEDVAKEAHSKVTAAPFLPPEHGTANLARLTETQDSSFGFVVQLDTKHSFKYLAHNSHKDIKDNYEMSFQNKDPLISDLLL